jgi:hypothetical protein
MRATANGRAATNRSRCSAERRPEGAGGFEKIRFASRGAKCPHLSTSLCSVTRVSQLSTAPTIPFHK